MDQTTQQHDAELEARYEQERMTRMTEGVREYRSLRDLNVDFDADPYVEPGFTRDPIVEETEVVIVGGGLGRHD